jgi:hypothetical protein
MISIFIINRKLSVKCYYIISLICYCLCKTFAWVTSSFWQFPLCSLEFNILELIKFCILPFFFSKSQSKTVFHNTCHILHHSYMELSLPLNIWKCYCKALRTLKAWDVDSILSALSIIFCKSFICKSCFTSSFSRKAHWRVYTSKILHLSVFFLLVVWMKLCNKRIKLNHTYYTPPPLRLMLITSVLNALDSQVSFGPLLKIEI